MRLPGIPPGVYWLDRYKSRYWAVFSPEGRLVCVTLYKKGAEEVIRLLGSLDDSNLIPASRSFAAHFGPWEPAFPSHIHETPHDLKDDLKGG